MRLLLRSFRRLLSALRAPRREQRAAALWRRCLTGTTVVCALTALATVPPADGSQSVPPDLDATLQALASYVDRYYARAQSIVGTERITIQTLASDLTPDGPGRRLVYDIRVEWGLGDDGEPTGKVVRELVRASGRAPECLDPPSITPEPLAMLRSSAQEKFIFSLAGTARVSGRAARLVEYRGRRTDPVRGEFPDQCARIDLGNRMAGRIWMDDVSGEVLRVDEHLPGQVTIPIPRSASRHWSGRSIEFERVDTSIRYRRVTFTDPVETVLLPESIDSVTVARVPGISRLRVLQEYSGYRRFVTGGRVVE